MNLHDDHRLLFGSAFGFFAVLTSLIAIFPALNNQANNAPLPDSQPLSADELAGKRLFVANGCVSCHTQQVRNVAMDQVWGGRPSIAADYARIDRMDLWRNTATLMGTERTGPDLTSIGERQPSSTWHLLHLYNPRAVVAASIMPAYEWLFEYREEAAPGDTVVAVPEEYKRGPGTVVARPEALQLVAYLQSLKQPELPGGTAAPDFLYQAESAPAEQSDGAANTTELDGAALYATHCQACHQPNGQGLKGAFPSLQDSSVVLAEDPAKLIGIVMKGYDGRVSEGFAVMPPIGTIAKLKPAEVRAIINHERNSWGNQAPEVSQEQVNAVLQSLQP